MKTTFRYLFLVFLSSGIATLIYYIAEQQIKQYGDWAKIFLFICILGTWGWGFYRWLMAAIKDDRNPFGFDD